MDARKRINQNRKKQGKQGGQGRGGQGRGRQTGGGQKKGSGNKRPGLLTANKRLSSGNTSGNKKQTLKRTKTGLKVVTANKKTKPISDLRQLIKPKATPKTKQTAIKKRLGLQSSSAKERARQQQMSKNRGGTARMDQEQVIIIQRPTVVAAPSTSRTSSKNRVWRSDQGSRAQPQVPTVIVAQTQQRQQSGQSVIVSNLNPSVTQTDILELFGDVGNIASYQSINSSTAMVTYNSGGDAQRAIQTYNNRYLDGLPMQVTLIPTPSTSGGGRAAAVSQTFRRVFVEDQ